MTLKNVVMAGLHNAQSSALVTGVTGRNRPTATGLKREEASRILPSRNPLGLRHPALTPPPAELRLGRHASGSTTGRRTAARGKASGYDVDAPWAWRAREAGTALDLAEHLRAVRKHAEGGGGTLLECVADGTLWGWRTRQALSSVAGAPLADWDNVRGRCTPERLALVDRALGELLGEEQKRRGGWSVTR